MSAVVLSVIHLAARRWEIATVPSSVHNRGPVQVQVYVPAQVCPSIVATPLDRPVAR